MMLATAPAMHGPVAQAARTLGPMAMGASPLEPLRGQPALPVGDVVGFRQAAALSPALKFGNEGFQQFRSLLSSLSFWITVIIVVIDLLLMFSRLGRNADVT
jgi:hypothetical protein